MVAAGSADSRSSVSMESGIHMWAAPSKRPSKRRSKRRGGGSMMANRPTPENAAGRGRRFKTKEAAGAYVAHLKEPATVVPSSAAFKRLPDPPFYRGDKGEWDAPYCDRILDTTGNACDDEDPAYLIEWKPTSRDGDTNPISGACERHALDVDRRQVVRICTHPRKAVAS